MKQVNIDDLVTLENVKEDEILKFKKDMQESFTEAVVKEFGPQLDKPIPCDEDIEKSISGHDAVAYHIILHGKKVGGAVLTIDELKHYNSLDFFFIYVGEYNRGIGQKAWNAIEEKYPKTKVWETCTPYFEKRNIHFYVNKCGFKIVEYFNKYHHDPNMPLDEDLPGEEDFFRFEKVMK